MGYYTRQLIDYDSEQTTLRIFTADLNAGNFAAEVALQATLGSTINGITLGTLQKITYGNQVDSQQAAPTDPFAQREMKWRVDYQDDVTGDFHHVTLGTADQAQLDPNNRDVAHIGDAGVVDAFVTAFEAYAKSPAGNAVSVLRIPLVGRNI